MNLKFMFPFISSLYITLLLSSPTPSSTEQLECAMCDTCEPCPQPPPPPPSECPPPPALPPPPPPPVEPECPPPPPPQATTCNPCQQPPMIQYPPPAYPWGSSSGGGGGGGPPPPNPVVPYFPFYYNYPPGTPNSVTTTMSGSTCICVTHLLISIAFLSVLNLGMS